MARAKRSTGLRRRFRSFATAAGVTVRRARDYRRRRPRPGENTAERRAVITGIGAVTCLGLDTPTTWRNLVQGCSGIGPITQFDASHLPVRIAGEVRGFDPLQHVDGKEARRMSRCSHFAIAAAREALADAGITIGKDMHPERVGVVMGTAMGGFEMIDNNLQEYRKHGLRRGNPFALPASLANAPGHHISTVFGAKGPLDTVVAACASGTQSIGNAAELIRRGRSDLVFAGGVEATVIEAAIAAFSVMRVLASHSNDEPAKAARPFDANRDGFVYSEGCVVMMVESLDHALARGAAVYAEVLGMGVSSDAHHIAIPDPLAGGAIRAMQWALVDAGLDAGDIDHINSHGSGTQTNDPLETMAIKRVFGERAYDIPVNSIKSMVGHAMGAAGSIEALASILAIRDGLIPPTINLSVPDPECDLDYVPNQARHKEVGVVLSNSFGLGGQNASIAFGRVA